MSILQPAAGFTLPAPTRVGQATVVEQSRAAAEVFAAMLTARDNPRDIDRAIAEMEMSCRQPALAERAFYSYPRAGQTVTGPSIHLARELARCWGNLHHGLHEMRRDAEASEMQAYAWDLQQNLRIAHTFIVPHRLDRTGGAKVLVEMRDIYENNANNGSRRVREAIFAVLPPWYTERAKQLCQETLAAGQPDKPIEQRVADALAAFGNGWQITQTQLERRLGKPCALWEALDVVQLEVLYRSLRRNEITKDEAFPPEEKPVTLSDITGDGPAAVVDAVETPAGTVAAAPPGPPGEATPYDEPHDEQSGQAPQATAPQGAAPGAEGDPPGPDGTQPADHDQLRILNVRFNEAGITHHTGKGSTARNDEARFAWLARNIDTHVTSTADLTFGQAEHAISLLDQAMGQAKRITSLFDGLDATLTAEDRLRDLSRLVGRTVMGPRDLTADERSEIIAALEECDGSAAAWDAEVDAADLHHRDRAKSGSTPAGSD